MPHFKSGGGEVRLEGELLLLVGPVRFGLLDWIRWK